MILGEISFYTLHTCTSLVPLNVGGVLIKWDVEVRSMQKDQTRM